MESHISGSPLGNRSSLHQGHSLPKNSISVGTNGAFTSSIADSSRASKVRPTSEIFLQTPQRMGLGDEVGADEQWLADLQDYELTLRQMAEVQLDKNFKDELSAIEQWFEVLSESERTATLFALLHRTTPIQNRFFITLLQKLASGEIASPDGSISGPLTDSFLRQPQQHTSPNKSGLLFQPEILINNASVSNNSSALNYLQPQVTDSGSFMGTPAKDWYSSNNLPFSRQQFAPPTTPWTGDISRPKSATDATPTSGSSLRNQIATSPSQTGLLSPNASSVKRMPRQSSHRYNRSLSQVDEAYKNPAIFASAPGSNIFLGDGHHSWASMSNTPTNNGTIPRDKYNKEILSNMTLKMAALNTVSGRAQLDGDNRSLHRRRGSMMSDEDQNQPDNSRYGTPNDSALGNSNWMPYSDSKIMVNRKTKFAMHDTDTPIRARNVIQRSTVPLQQPIGSPTSSSGTPKKGPMNYLDPELLQDVATWLRVLRLHKYTDSLSDLNWKQLIELSDKDLEDRGVNALGARRKMLKVFEQIKEAQKEGQLV